MSSRTPAHGGESAWRNVPRFGDLGSDPAPIFDAADTRLRIVVAALLFAWLAGTPLPAQDAAAGKPFLHPLFTDHMVLQRNVTTTIAWMSRGTASGTRRDCPRRRSTPGSGGER